MTTLQHHIVAALVTIMAAASPLSLAAQDTPADSLEQRRARYVDELRRSITGREAQPAGEVFKNLTILRDVPAGRLLGIMDMGFGRSLGVSCEHCHTPGEWESDDKPEKRIAREMWDMVRTINTSLLKNITDLKSANPTVNCTTCHRGSTKPAINMQPT